MQLSDLPDGNDPQAVFAFAMTFDAPGELGPAGREIALARRRSSVEDLRCELYYVARESRHYGDRIYVATYGELEPLFRKFLAG